MAKTSMVEREKRRARVVKKYAAKRAELRETIRNPRASAEVRAAAQACVRDKAVAEGMLQFRQAALLKVARGQTTIEEVFRVIPSEHLLLEN